MTAVSCHWAYPHIRTTCFRPEDEVYPLTRRCNYSTGTGENQSKQLQQMPNVLPPAGFVLLTVLPVPLAENPVLKI